MAVIAVGPFRVYSRKANATEGILALGYRLQMPRIYARANATEMIEGKPFGNISTIQLIGHPVR